MAIVVSNVNEGPAVNVAAWFGTTVMVFGVSTRLWSKYSVLRKWTIDDVLIVVTMVSVLVEVDGLVMLDILVLIVLMKGLGLYNDCHYFDDGRKRSGGTSIISE